MPLDGVVLVCFPHCCGKEGGGVFVSVGGLQECWAVDCSLHKI